MLLQQTGPAVWLEFDFENELAEKKRRFPLFFGARSGLRRCYKTLKTV